MTIETVAFHKYEATRTEPSALGLSESVTKLIGFQCPRCAALNPPIAHGQTGQCPACSMHFQLWGNGLLCSDEPFTEGDTSVLDNFIEHPRESWPGPCGDDLDAFNPVLDE